MHDLSQEETIKQCGVKDSRERSRIRYGRSNLQTSYEAIGRGKLTCTVLSAYQVHRTGTHSIRGIVIKELIKVVPLKNNDGTADKSYTISSSHMLARYYLMIDSRLVDVPIPEGRRYI